MPVTIRGEVRGLRQTQDDLLRIAREIHGDEMVRSYQQAALMVMRDARLFAPVDTGRLKNSIVADVRVEDRVLTGVVGSNVHYAPHQELGTKTGIKPKRFLQRGFEKNLNAIKAMIQSKISGIIRR